MSERVMPIQTQNIKDRAVRAVCPTEVPWALVAEHERQCMTNHHQSLTRIAERGGFSPVELYYIVRDEAFQWRGWADDATAVKDINARLAELRSAGPVDAA